MKKTVLLLAAVALLVSGNALAQTDPGFDGIGVYFDPGATDNCLAGMFPGQYGPGFCYLCATNISVPGGVGGWELKLVTTGPVFVLDWGYQGAAINAATPPEFAVGLASPLPSGPSTVLLDMTIFLTGTDPIDFLIEPLWNASIPGLPAYADGDDPGNLLPLVQSTGGPGVPVASINGDCPVPNEAGTWGGVKAMYR